MMVCQSTTSRMQPPLAASAQTVRRDSAGVDMSVPLGGAVEGNYGVLTVRVHALTVGNLTGRLPVSVEPSTVERQVAGIQSSTSVPLPGSLLMVVVPPRS